MIRRLDSGFTPSLGRTSLVYHIYVDRMVDYLCAEDPDRGVVPLRVPPA